MLSVEVTRISFAVPGGVRAAGIARHSLQSVEAGLSETVRERLGLLVSELVTNAVQHGGAELERPLRVQVEASAERVRVEVCDPGSNGAGPVHRVEESGGYGLLLVDRLADGWGREAAAGGGSLAWFELDLAGIAEF